MASIRGTDYPIVKIALPSAVIAALMGTPNPCFSQGRVSDPDISAVVVKAGTACFASSVRFTGLVVPRAEAIVNFNVQGYQISEVSVREGQMVTSGQVLAKLSRLGRNAEATGRPAPPAQNAATQQQQQPASLELTAPAAGLLSESTAKIGEVAASIPMPPPMGSGPLFRIIVNNELEVEGDIPSVHLPKLKVGQLARIHLDDGRDVSGTVRSLLPEIDRKTQLGKVRISIDSDPAIRAGMFATGTIDASHSCGVSIPRSSVQYQTEGTTVQLVHDDMVETHRVRLGFYSDTAVEVLDGVKQGDLVIANTGTALHDGDQVKPVVADDSSQAGSQ